MTLRGAVKIIRALLYSVEGLLVGLIGRPLLWLIKFLRWPILIFGFFFNSISIYDPATNNTINTHTYIPLIAGIVLFSVGTTIARYDEIHKEFVDLSPAEDERGKAEKSIMGFSPMTQKLILESQANQLKDDLKLYLSVYEKSGEDFTEEDVEEFRTFRNMLQDMRE
ncbi:MAG: hypothetical protein GX660_07130 [Clostridiaceae bacterium]|nr:hypothetical protein [Clostridiaceae bacterium]